VTVRKLIPTHLPPAGPDRESLLRCIADCFDCVATCLSCADACLGEDDVWGLVRCIRRCLDCAAAGDATGRIVTRQTQPDFDVIRRALEACVAACRACAAECELHAQRYEHCRICAETCQRCEQSCNDLLATIPTPERS